VSAHLIARRGDDTALTGQASDHDRFPYQARIEQTLDGHEKRVEV
jgi:hypothetical protein